MKRSRFSETQIVGILKEADAGMPVKEVCRKYGISDSAYYNWKKKYGGLGVSEVRRLRELEAENAKLKRMYAELSLENDALKELISKSSEAAGATRGGVVSGGRMSVIDWSSDPRSWAVALGLVQTAAGPLGEGSGGDCSIDPTDRGASSLGVLAVLPAASFCRLRLESQEGVPGVHRAGFTASFQEETASA